MLFKYNYKKYLSAIELLNGYSILTRYGQKEIKENHPRRKSLMKKVRDRMAIKHE